ncbi:MAG: hypothetical protein JO069_22930 [Verrucomicrobia bacterium]|nr:hypothetical protein [Verrucomicrobiota bacterium]
MLKCYEIFDRSSPELVNEIFTHLLEKEKAVYKAAIQNIAAQRKLRPVFIERKPKPERHLWLKQALARKPADDFAVQILQIWLLGAKRDLICEFLDQLGIPHDGKGVVDNLPEEPSPERLQHAVDALLEKHPSEVVAVYLHAFQAMDDHAWTNLDRILETDSRLALGTRGEDRERPAAHPL